MVIDAPGVGTDWSDNHICKYLSKIDENIDTTQLPFRCGCKAGTYFLIINPKGDVGICGEHYFGNIFEPKVILKPTDKIKFTFGVGLFIPFDQEQDSFAYFPIVQTKLNFNQLDVIIGSLENNHNFPVTIINDLASLYSQMVAPIYFPSHNVTSIID